MLDWLLKPATDPTKQQLRFHVEAEPRIVETSSNIIVTCYTSKAREGIVPCRYCWYRTKNGVTTVIEHVKGSTYMCEPADLGTTIKVEVTVRRESCRVLMRSTPAALSSNSRQFELISLLGSKWKESYLLVREPSQSFWRRLIAKESAH